MEYWVIWELVTVVCAPFLRQPSQTRHSASCANVVDHDFPRCDTMLLQTSSIIMQRDKSCKWFYTVLLCLPVQPWQDPTFVLFGYLCSLETWDFPFRLSSIGPFSYKLNFRSVFLLSDILSWFSIIYLTELQYSLVECMYICERIGGINQPNPEDTNKGSPHKNLH